jgi:hypothetical protein
MILFYDGCHKIYYANEDEHETIGKMVSYEYDPIHTAGVEQFEATVRDLYEGSCGLRFIHPADLSDNRPNVYQFAAYDRMTPEEKDAALTEDAEERLDEYENQVLEDFFEQMRK